VGVDGSVVFQYSDEDVRVRQTKHSRGANGGVDGDAARERSATEGQGACLREGVLLAKVSPSCDEQHRRGKRGQDNAWGQRKGRERRTERWYPR
jgi:hypothetical protein